MLARGLVFARLLNVSHALNMIASSTTDWSRVSWHWLLVNCFGSFSRENILLFDNSSRDHNILGGRSPSLMDERIHIY